MNSRDSQHPSCVDIVPRPTGRTTHGAINFPACQNRERPFFFLSLSLFFSPSPSSFFFFSPRHHVRNHRTEEEMARYPPRTSFTSLLRRSQWTRRRNSAVRLICLMGLVHDDIALPKCGSSRNFLLSRGSCLLLAKEIQRYAMEL